MAALAALDPDTHVDSDDALVPVALDLGWER